MQKTRLSLAKIRIKLLFFLVTLSLSAHYINDNKSALLGGDKLLNPTQEVPFVTKVLEDEVIPRLSTKENTFTLKQKTTLVSQAQASDIATAARALLAVDLETGEVLYQKNSDARLPVASLTKIMTAVVALDLASQDEYFEVSEFASSQIPTKIGVVPDQKLNLYELLEALLLTSANDAATVIQEGVDRKYGAPIFIEAMNEKVSFLGLADTSFANPQGFDDPQNYSTAKELALLTQYAVTNYPIIAEIVKKEYVFLPENNNHKQFDLYNWNGLIGVYPGAEGVKIGNTGKAGKTTIVIAERGGKKMLATVLGAKDIYDRDLTAASLLDIGFRKTSDLPPINITERELLAKYQSWKY